ncbi:DNA/RNA helicase superfamily II [Gluconacetobacter sacchari DSM 12717]|uniref:DEAD/DEAH box helicase n=2 Tax=Gluconacetobacter sacchari TaxID=92759 RepID=A0A7W4IGN2_9PROT|nr:DEAD/DEAH box helicase [Gluconacetobacter sacchari]MBB2162486.1 DEAD/DEAH box helicase [Gluconacetobacter sacchari]GBQ24925.1 DNA/RNA helicase superfamily II [Gluconacetobacter sacchari DSM 12717]
MRHEITDITLDTATQTERMGQAGLAYARQGRVSALKANLADGTITARVAGSARTPYDVSIRFTGRETITSKCSCPIGTGCKHVAATLFAAMKAPQAEGPPNALPALRSATPVPTRQNTVLPADVAHWFETMRPLLEPQRPTAGNPTVLYIVQPLGGERGKKPGKNASADTPQARQKKLAVSARLVQLNPNGEPSRGEGTILTLWQIDQLTQDRAASDGITATDRALVQQMHTRPFNVDMDGGLALAGGYAILLRLIATGRARWGSVHGPTMLLLEPVPARPVWKHDGEGRACIGLAADGLSADTITGLVAPPVLIDPTSGAVHPVEFGLSSALAGQILRLPPIAPGDVADVARQWHALAPAMIPPPPPPEIHERRDIVPVPTVLITMDKVKLRNARRGYYHTSAQKVDCAVSRLSFAYRDTIVDARTAGHALLVREDDRFLRIMRDDTAEQKAEERLLEFGLLPLDTFEGALPSEKQQWDFAPAVPATASDFASFVIRDIAILRKAGWKVETARNFPLKLAEIAPEKIEADLVPSGIDWFDMRLGANVDGKRIDLVPALRRMLARMDAEEVMAFLETDDPPPDIIVPIPLDDGRVAPVELAKLLPILRALLLLSTTDNSAGKPGVASHDLGLLAALDQTLGTLRGAEMLRKLARELTSLRFPPTPLPPGFLATLRPYQQTGLDWLEALARGGLGGLLADDMGLGKTVQALAHIAVRRCETPDAPPVLVVAPTSVLPNWQAEIARFAPTLSILILHGAERHGLHAEIASHDIVLTTYPLLIRDRDALTPEPFSLVVFDEAHTLKNPATNGHATARALKAERRLALTGTPIENRLTDAWALFDLIAPGLLGTTKSFGKQFRTPIEKHGDPEIRARLARTLRPFLLRRTKDLVAPDLPRKSVLSVAIELEPAQRALHESQRLLMQKQVREEIERVGLMRAQIVVLTALTRLRQVCCDPRLLGEKAITRKGGQPAPSAKLTRLLEMLGDMLTQGRRIIVFSQFTTMLDLIKPALARMDIAWTELTGSTKDRRTPVNRFQSGEVPLILVSLKAGGTGLNLTAADTVILYDPWWNPAIEAQAIDRAHRLGQTKKVFVYRLIARDTIEEKILILQERKAAFAEALWSENAATPAALSEDDIAFLLG